MENSDSYFDGGLLQLIGWRILGTIVTTITLGICLPWSYCMIYRWEAKHTVIDGKRLVFDGSSLQLFGNWVKWFLLTIITLGIYGLWLPIKFQKWKTLHTHFDYQSGGYNGSSTGKITQNSTSNAIDYGSAEFEKKLIEDQEADSKARAEARESMNSDEHSQSQFRSAADEYEQNHK